MPEKGPAVAAEPGLFSTSTARSSLLTHEDRRYAFPNVKRSGWGAFMAISLLSAAVSAEEADTLAESLFREGREQMKAGHLDAACSAFAESLRLDAAAGTVLNLGFCEIERGRLATGWARLRQFLDTVPASDDRRKIARSKVEEIEPRLPRLLIRVHGTLPAGAVVRLDERPLGEGSLGFPFAVDPGEHRVTVQLATGEPRAIPVHAVESEVRELELGPFATSSAPVVVSTAPSVPTRTERRPHPGLRTGAYVAVTVSAAALVTSATFGVLSLSRRGSVRDHCNEERVCDSVGLEAAQDGQRYLTLGNVGLAVGLVGAATAAILYWQSNEHHREVRVGVQGDAGMITWRGTL